MTPSPKSPPDPSARSGPFHGWGFSWGGWLDNRHGEWWLLAQVVLIAAHLLPPWPAPGSWGYAWPLPVAAAGALLFLLGLLLAAQAFRRLGSSLTPLPDPKPGAALVTSGAYGRCRHPLYQAVLLCSFGVALALGSLLHLALLFALSAVLGGKARREEQLLLALHPGYVDYRAAVPAIVPRLPWLDWRR
ncbi:MAG: methyltransferase [Cyanobium sp.]